MNEVRDMKVPSVTDDVLDIVELGEVTEETKQVYVAPFAPDSAVGWGYPG